MRVRPATLLLVLSVGHASLVTAADKGPQWVVVTAPAFREAIVPLCEHRHAQGLRVSVLRTTDILSADEIRKGETAPLVKQVHELCRAAEGPSYVLLVGAAQAADPVTAEQTAVPSLRGTAGRMVGQPSDIGFGCPDGKRPPTVAVGRFPARTVEQVEQMVQKTLRFERDLTPAPWRHRLTLFVGHPGGSSAWEKQVAELIVTGVARDRFSRVHPLWTAQSLIHVPGSPYCVPDDDLHETAWGYLAKGQIFAFYLGHSNASGLWSRGARFLDREDWMRIKIPRGAGVLFSCGCYGCQLVGAGGEGYGLAAMRNPDGPAAVLGAHGESYAAMGQLAIDGLLECLRQEKPPLRLADYWLATQAGLARGPMDAVTFWLFDQADGSRGKVPLDVQRLEHLEMWLMLGDPALRLPIDMPSINLATRDSALAGGSVTITGTLPPALASVVVRLTLERPLGSLPSDLATLPVGSAPAGQLLLANHRRANDYVLQARELQPADRQFHCVWKLPKSLPWPRLVVRAVATTDGQSACGVLTLPVTPAGKSPE